MPDRSPRDIPDENPPPPLGAWLLDRLDEEHEVAEREYAYPSGTPRDWEHVAGEADSMLVSMFSPARVLAEVAAKRRIVEHENKWGEDDVVLRLLALPYAEHPTYRSEYWMP